MKSATDEEIRDIQNKQYWPWPLALAYVQQGRFSTVPAASEVLLDYRSDSTLNDFTASSAVARIYEVETGKSYGADSETYWDDVAQLEANLVGALEAGQLHAFGRKERDGGLERIEAIEWVGCEVSPERTSDLVLEGWRKCGPLEQALSQSERKVRFFDLHLKGAAVREYADALEQERNERFVGDMYGGLFQRVEEIEAEQPALEMGYWSPLVAGAWISSRCNNFTAAIQKLEGERHCERGGLHSSAVYNGTSQLARKRGWSDLFQALELLSNALQRGESPGANGQEGRFGPTRIIERHEWRNWRGPHHENDGVSVLPNVFNVAFPAEEVISAFPCETNTPSPRARPSIPCDDDILKKCDEMHDRGIRVRDICRDIKKEPGFEAVQNQLARALTDGRYPRTGRAGIRPEK